VRKRWSEYGEREGGEREEREGEKGREVLHVFRMVCAVEGEEKPQIVDFLRRRKNFSASTEEKSACCSACRLPDLRSPENIKIAQVSML